jgi:hypothetical protein
MEGFYDLKVNGRGELTGYAEVGLGDEQEVRFRIDDSARPEFWAEFSLSREQLESMLRDLDAEHDGHCTCNGCLDDHQARTEGGDETT